MLRDLLSYVRGGSRAFKERVPNLGNEKKNLKMWDESMQYLTNFYFKNANSELNIMDFY